MRKIFILGLLLLLVPISLFAQNIRVSGKVVDASNNEALIGVNVVQAGTTNGTITDIDGNYSIEVPSDAQLQFSYIGYVSQTIDVAGNSTIPCFLTTDDKELEQVVVVGYGTSKRSDVTGSIASVGEDMIKETPSQNFTQAIQGRVAGVEINRTSSRPGANQQIRIRGTRSLNASNDPLIVLDGIPFAGSISDIDPSTIKSMDILKDASSTAIYGSRGANGVIIITTIKGSKNQPLVTYNGYVGATKIFSKFPMMNGEKYLAMKNAAGFQGGSWAPLGSMDDPNVDTDWQDEFFKTGVVTSHDLTIGAGSENGSYTFGTSYYNETGVVPNQGFKRISVRGSFDQNIKEFLKLGITTQNAYSDVEGEGSNPIYNVLQQSPLVSPYDENGNIREIIEINGSDIARNPLLYDEAGDLHSNPRRTFASYNSAYAEVRFFEGFKYRMNVGLNFRQSNLNNFNSYLSPYSGYNETNSNGERNSEITKGWTIEHLLTFDRQFGKHNINAVAMYSRERTTFDQMKVAGSGISADALQFYNLGLSEVSVTVNPDEQKYWQRGLISYMARVQYQFNNKYMLSATFRSDGASVLADGHKWHTYPAVSFGWNMANENFMKSIDWLDILKLRAGYGETSNQSIDPYATLGSVKKQYYVYEGEKVIGYTPNAVPNEELGWEYSSTWNFGLDFGLWNSRLTGTFEYYVQKTNDILMQMSLPSSSGIEAAYWANIGKTENKGWELTLNGTIINNKNGWNWDLGVNIYSNKNKIVELSGEQKRDVGNGWFVGEPIDAIYDYKKIGIYQLGQEEIAAAEVEGGKPGYIRVAYNLEDGDPVEFDANGIPNRVINGNDRFVIGTPEGHFQGGFNTTVSYKGWDLGMTGSFKAGGTLICTLYQPASYLNMMIGRRGNVDVDFWTPENPTNDYPSMCAGGDNPTFGSTLGYFDASYLKVRTITLGYTFPKEWVEKIKLNSARMYATISNPFVLFSPFKKESGLDPEPNSMGRNDTSVETGLPSRFLSVGYNTPSTRQFIFGVKLTF